MNAPLMGISHELAKVQTSALTDDEFCALLLDHFRRPGLPTEVALRAIGGFTRYLSGTAAGLEQALELAPRMTARAIAARRRRALILHVRSRLSPRSDYAAANHIAAIIAGVIESPAGADEAIEELRRMSGAKGWRQILRHIQNADCHDTGSLCQFEGAADNQASITFKVTR